MVCFCYVPAGNEFTLFVSQAFGSDMYIFIAPDSGGLVQQLGRFTCSAANRYIAPCINGSRIEVLQFIFDRQVNISS